MRMQKEEKIVVVLLLMALGSLTVASWAFSPEETEESTGQAKEDSQISLEGIVLEIKPTKTGGHLLIKLDTTQMPVFVPREAGVDEVQRRVNTGDRVRVKGMVAEFGGKEELKVSRAADIEVI
ncbi:MAG: hypothetical protein QUS09_07655 [Methanotrichaceae archaeon]|nr:hypothetical protein [Methanotrichaceae archaeon]